MSDSIKVSYRSPITFVVAVARKFDSTKQSLPMEPKIYVPTFRVWETLLVALRR